jgi:hypothetical protein
MSKHTKGPWHVFTDNYGEVVIQNENEMICSIGEKVIMDEIGNESMWKDASLIAAAPELLEACKLVKSLSDLPKTELSSESWEKVKEVCLQAITKAEKEGER